MVTPQNNKQPPHEVHFLPLEISIILFASWTLAYHSCILFQLPAKYIYFPFWVLLVGFLALLIKLRLHREGPIKSPLFFKEKRNFQYAITVVLLALITGLFTIIVSRPNADDIVYFHRAMLQLDRLNEPFIIKHAVLNINNIPVFSLMHGMSSYEHFVAMVGSALGFDPLWVYQNVSSFVAGFLLTIVYILLYRQFGLSRRFAVVATLAAFIFLIIDGNLTRSFGNFALVRCWQGKVILIMLLIPMTYLFAARFLRHPSLRHFFILALLSICASGLSSTGLFLSPAAVFLASMSYLSVRGVSKSNVKNAVSLNFSSLYCISIAVGFALNIFPTPENTNMWATSFWPSIWWANLQKFIIGDISTLIRNLLILLVVPLFALRKKMSFYPIALSVWVFILFASPLTGPFWIDKIMPAAYWRIAYLFPLPWCAGLLILGFVNIKNLNFSKKITQISVFAVIILSVFISYETSVLSGTKEAKEQVFFKPVHEYKFNQAELDFSRSVKQQLDHKNLLCPYKIAVVIALLNPTIKFEAARPDLTLTICSLIGFENEGKRRVMAQKFVTDYKYTLNASYEKAFHMSLQNGVDAIIVRAECLLSVRQILNAQTDTWYLIKENEEHALILKQK